MNCSLKTKKTRQYLRIRRGTWLIFLYVFLMGIILIYVYNYVEFELFIEDKKLVNIWALDEALSVRGGNFVYGWRCGNKCVKYRMIKQSALMDYRTKVVHNLSGRHSSFFAVDWQINKNWMIRNRKRKQENKGMFMS